MNNIRDATRGGMLSTGRGGRGCPESPSTSATELSTDTSSRESSRHYRPPKRVSGEERLRSRSKSNTSRLYPPPPPPPPPPPLSLGKDDYMMSVRTLRSRSLDRRQKQPRDGSKSRQQLPRPITTTAAATTTTTGSSKERSNSRSSPTQKSRNRNHSSRSHSRSTNHRGGGVHHHDQQREENIAQQWQQRTGTPAPSSGRSVSRAREKSSHQLDNVDPATVHVNKSSTSTTNTKPSSTIRSKSAYAARGKSCERKQSEDVISSPCASSKLYRSELPNTTSTTSSPAASGDRGGNRPTTGHSQKPLPTRNSVRLDKHGCCIYHPIVQLQRPKCDGTGGWRILSKTCALCMEKDSEQKRHVPPCYKSANEERPIIEQDHLNLNTTTATPIEIAYGSTDASLERSPRDRDEEEFSITLSCLESDGDELSTVSFSAPSSVRTKTGSKSPAPSSNCTARSMSASVASQKSHKSHTGKKSLESARSVTCRVNGKASKQTDHFKIDNVAGRRCSEPESKRSSEHAASSRRSSTTAKRDDGARKSGTDVLDRAEAALRRIKLLEAMSDRSTTTSPSSRTEKSTKPSSNDESSHGRTRTTKPPHDKVMETSSNKRNSAKTSNSVYHTRRPENNPYLENDLPNEVPPIELMTHPQIITPNASQSNDTLFWEPPERNKDWMKYATSVSARNGVGESDGNVKKGGKPKGRTLTDSTNNTRKIVWKVKQMPYCDQFGDHGIYSGHVNEDGRPDGSGTMKYENGVFYEGSWTDGCQDAAAQYARIRSGFTSWGGKGKSATRSGMVLPWNARKIDAHDVNEKSNVRGMEWTDFKGQSGRYTGEVNQDKIPHGNGMMRYDFGLIAEGEWVRGVLKEGPHDHLAAAFGSGGSVVSGMHRIHSNLSLGSRSVGFPSGAISAASGGGMSVFMPPSIVGVQQFIPSHHAVMAHQNAMMSIHGSTVGSVYGGMVIPVQQVQYGPTAVGGQMPPVSNIIIS